MASNGKNGLRRWKTDPHTARCIADNASNGHQCGNSARVDSIYCTVHRDIAHRRHERRRLTGINNYPAQQRAAAEQTMEQAQPSLFHESLSCEDFETLFPAIFDPKPTRLQRAKQAVAKLFRMAA